MPHMPSHKPKRARRASSDPKRAQIPRAAFKLKETAEMLGVSENTVRRLIERKLIHPLRYTRHMLFSVGEIERFVRDGQ